MKKRNFIVALILSTCLFGCDESIENTISNNNHSTTSTIEDNKKENKVHIYSIPEGVEKYENAKLLLNGTECPMYLVKTNALHSWSGDNYARQNNGVAIFSLEGRVNVEVKCNYDVTFDTKVRPLKYNINPIINQETDTISFQIYDAGHYVIEPNGESDKTIHIFVQSMLRETKVEELDQEKLIYFGPGLHTKDNNKYLSGDSSIELQNDQIVYLDYGAVVRGRFTATSKSNITIMGPGVVDGSTFERVSGKSQFIPFDFNYCRNVTFKDFTMLDTAGWTINWYFMTNSKIENIKIISSRSNGDGISLQSCIDIEVKDCFVRSWDDSLVVKNYPRWNDRTQHGTTDNILFENCTLWTDLAQSMEVGYETVGQIMEDITFNNITVLHNYHKPVMSIHNGNNANIKRVKFTNITVEDASMGQGDAGSNTQLVDITAKHSATWSNQHTITSLGQIEDITVKNILVKAGSAKLKFRFEGSKDTRPDYLNNEHFVKNVELTDISWKGKGVDNSFQGMTWYQNEYTENIKLSLTGEMITGSEFIRYMSKDELKEYGEQYIVLVD